MPHENQSKPIMRHMTARGFTIIELLVSLSICITMAGVATTAVMQLKKTSQFIKGRTNLASEAAFIYTRMEKNLAQIVQGCKIYAESIPSPNLDAPASPLAGVRLAFYAELPDLITDDSIDVFNGVSKNTRTQPGVWMGWEWRPSPSASDRNAGILKMGFSTIKREKDIPGFYDLNQIAEPRRSKHRSMNDNDFSTLPGASITTYRITGDYTDLFGEDNNGNGVLNPGEDTNGDNGLASGNLGVVSFHVSKFQLSWVTHRGTVVPLTNTGTISASGLYRDARPSATDNGNPIPESILADYPSVLRVEFTLREPETNKSQKPIEEDYQFSFPISLETAQGIGL